MVSKNWDSTVLKFCLPGAVTYNVPANSPALCGRILVCRLEHQISREIPTVAVKHSRHEKISMISLFSCVEGYTAKIAQFCMFKFISDQNVKFSVKASIARFSLRVTSVHEKSSGHLCFMKHIGKVLLKTKISRCLQIFVLWGLGRYAVTHLLQLP